MRTEANVLKRRALSVLTWIRPSIIDFYVLSEVFMPFLGGIIFFTFVFLMFQALRLADFFIIHGVSGMILGKLASLMVLSFLPTALPIAFLIGVLIAFGRLSADSELVAMKANGISVFRLSVPVIILSSAVVVLSLALNLDWVPWGERTFKQTLIKVSNTKVAGSIREGTFTSGFFDLLIFADKVDNKTNKLHHVFIYDEREAKNPLAVISKEGEIISVKNKSLIGTSAMLKLHNGSIHRNNPEESTYQKIDFGQYRLFLKIDEGADTATMKPRMISKKELLERIKANDPKSKYYFEFLGEYWRRYALAITPLVFVFLGIGFGTVRTRAVRSGAALIALAVVIVYWGLQAAATVIVQKGMLPPFVVMQIPNLAMILIAIKAFKTAIW